MYIYFYRLFHHLWHFFFSFSTLLWVPEKIWLPPLLERFFHRKLDSGLTVLSLNSNVLDFLLVRFPGFPSVSWQTDVSSFRRYTDVQSPLLPHRFLHQTRPRSPVQCTPEFPVSVPKFRSKIRFNFLFRDLLKFVSS